MAKSKVKAKAAKKNQRKAPKAKALAAPKKTFPRQVHVLKAGDKIPVQVVDQSHLDRLQSEHGRDAVEDSQ